MIEIISNGSKCYGEAPDSIDQLIEVLAVEPLDPRFLNYGRFIIPMGDGRVKFFGNFYRLSHVFNLITDESEVIGRLTAAICDNMVSDAFQEIVPSIERARDKVLILLDFARHLVDTYGPMIDSDEEIGGADAVDWLGDLVRGGRKALSVVTKGNTYPLPPSPGQLLKAAELVEEWWLREGTHAFAGAPAGIFALRQMITEFNACPGHEIEPGVFSGCVPGGGDCPRCGR